MNFMEKVKQNLKVGIIVKNYKELCNLLGEKVKTGESKQIQLKNWERHFKFKKNGHQFIITEILPEPEAKIDGRHVGNHSLFIDEIAELILMTAKESISSKKLSKNSWMKAVGLVNSEYGKTRNIRNASWADTNPAAINDFYDFGAGATVEGYLVSSMDYLDKTGLATIKKNYVAVSMFTEDTLLNLESKYNYSYLPGISSDDYEAGKFLSLKDYLWQQSPEDSYETPITRYPVKEFEKMKKEFIKKNGLDISKRKERYRFWNDFLKENCWRMCYIEYDVTLNAAQKSQVKTVDKNTLKNMKSNLNQKVYSHLVSLITKRYTKNFQKYQEDVQHEMQNNTMKIGKMQERFTKTYKEKSLYIKIVNLKCRLELIEALIKTGDELC